MFHSLSPDQYKTLPAYPEIIYGLAPSPYGEMAVAWWSDDNGADKLCYLALHSDLQKTTDQLHKMFPRNAFTRDDKRAAHFAKDLTQNAPLPPVLMKGTPFFLKIWETLYHTKPGQTMSYRTLAGLAGKPTASRAVGTAMSTNPIALIVPCHRVLGSNGGLGGYAYGLDVKKQLLAAEASR